MKLPRVFIGVNISKDGQKGISIFEMLVTLGIFSFILAGGFFFGADSFKSYYFLSEERMFYSLLRLARERAMQNINQSSHGIIVTDEKLILFQGESFNDSPSQEDFPRNENIQIESSFRDSMIVFENLSGINEGGEFKISDGVRETVITVNIEGGIN